MRSRTCTPGRTRAATPEAAALLTALVALGGCLEATRGTDADAGGGKGDGGGPVFDAGAGDGATGVDASSEVAATIVCPASNLAVATIDGLDSDAAWDDASAPATFDPNDPTLLRSEVPDYQANASSTFRCVRTSSTLYLYFTVFDGTDASTGAIVSDEVDPTLSDGLVLFFDGKRDGGAYAADDHWLAIDVANQSVQSDAMAFTAATDADADKTWRLELAILLDAIAPDEARAEVIGFDFALHDEDGFSGGSPDMRAFFAAEADATMTGCPPGIPDPYCDTGQFATLALAP